MSPEERALLANARRATLATVAPDGRPRLVPVCFVLADGTDSSGRALLYTPLDEKPKRVEDPRRLARARDLLADARVTLLVDRWDEDWSRLAWVRIDGTADLLIREEGPAEHARAVALLRVKYPQYAEHALEARPMIRIAIEGAVAWGRVTG